MLPLVVCCGGNGTTLVLTNVSALKLTFFISTYLAVINSPQPPPIIQVCLSNPPVSGKDSTADVQKLQQQLQDIKEQVS
jgi:hypothetical protein